MMKRIGWLGLVTLLAATNTKAIVGGTEDKSPLAQATVMVLNSNGGMCSAVVVAPDAVLTAAHCVTGASEYRVHYKDEAGQPVLIAPAKNAVHPGFEPKAIEARRRSIDLALVRVPQPFPERFARATLSSRLPAKGDTVTVGGYGLARENEPKTTGTFRTADLKAIEPYGPSKILLWAQGAGAGACQGDSGGPMLVGGAVAAITSWSSAGKERGCGGLTQGVLVAPQRDWIDKTLARWESKALWD
ncbi:S1 family peptidase [Microvirga flavescens]|uniref:S1 family peptidase n=1 Tax=Microvirga flavescens TaxID=2249811 RepID=UPI001FE0A794|nr:trypsin-like serine protease [Microvirga flavescens]